nr:hypothetical protein [Vibrio splendidus]MCC4883012.1 hypothetical protein [Vibrio splendidus]
MMQFQSLSCIGWVMGAIYIALIQIVTRCDEFIEFMGDKLPLSLLVITVVFIVAVVLKGTSRTSIKLDK